MQDKEIVCQGPFPGTPCPDGATFLFTANDQEYYKEKGFEPPKRCRACRDEKKQYTNAHGGKMPPYQAREQKRRRGDRDEFGLGDN